MHFDSARARYGFHALENQSDAYVASLYLEHVDHCMRPVYETLDWPSG